MQNAVDIKSNEEWSYLLTLIPKEFEELARQSHAVVRERNVPDASSLLRMILAYSVSDLSLKDTAAWATEEGLANITGPGLFYRVRESEEWLSKLLARTLGDSISKPASSPLRLRIVDATIVNGPGKRAMDWRAHVVFDPSSGGFVSVKITDEHGGERLDLHDFKKGDVVLGDRAYGTAKGLAHVTSKKGFVVARINPRTLRVCDEKKKVFLLSDRACGVPIAGAMNIPVIVPIPPKMTTKHKSWNLEDAVAWLPARVVVGRTRSHGLIWILTTLPESMADARTVLDLYRMRWQIELFFKRLKSILHFDSLPSRRGPTARAWILGRLLVAALAQRLTSQADALSPWGYDISHETARLR